MCCKKALRGVRAPFPTDKVGSPDACRGRDLNYDDCTWANGRPAAPSERAAPANAGEWRRCVSIGPPCRAACLCCRADSGERHCGGEGRTTYNTSPDLAAQTRRAERVREGGGPIVHTVLSFSVSMAQSLSFSDPKWISLQNVSPRKITAKWWYSF